VDRRRRRRALTEEELLRLLDAASRRLLHYGVLIRRGRRKGQPAANIKPSRRRELIQLGRERALTYAVLFATGLRTGELRSITVGQTELDAERPFLHLRASDAKNRKEARVPLRQDVAEALRLWLLERLAICQEAARKAGKPIPGALHPGEALLCVPKALYKIFSRDLAFAGIQKVDETGRTLDVHCLRMSLSTYLLKAGVAPRVVQAAMRHSDIRLTTVVYTDESLLPVAEAVEVLPALPLERVGMLPAPAAGDLAPDLVATLAPDIVAMLAPVLAPTPDVLGQMGSPAGRSEDGAGGEDEEGDSTRKADSRANSRENRPVADGGRYWTRTSDLYNVSVALYRLS